MTVSNTMMAVFKKFPFWPDGATHIIGLRDQSDRLDFKVQCVWSRDNENFYQIDSSGNVSWSISVSASWKIYCTQLEHIAYRAELFKGAPEGAELYDANKNHEDWWIRAGDNVRSIEKDYEGVWYVGGLYDSSDCIMIPRPTEEEMQMLEDSKVKLFIGDTAKQLKDGVTPKDKEEWMPEIDVKCLGNILDLVTHQYSYVEVIPLRDLGAEWVVQVGAGGRPAYCDEFRPLKTEREKFVEGSLKLIKTTMTFAEEVSIKALFGEQYDNGARFTGGAE